jgi:II/X family phage/plasmid replication protein
MGSRRASGSIRTAGMRVFMQRSITTHLAELIKIWDNKLAIELWKETNKDIFRAIGNENMKVPSDDKVLDKLKLAFGTVSKKTGKMSYTRAESVYKSYRCIRAEGYQEWHKHTSSSTRSRHLSDLESVGFSLALLQQHKGNGLASEVVPMIRYINVNFGEQRPAWAA